jgi:hypothetical protein
MLEIEILKNETVTELHTAWMVSYFAIAVLLYTLKNIQNVKFGKQEIEVCTVHVL